MIFGFAFTVIAALLVSTAALARLAALVVPAEQHGLLWVAAITWTSAYLLLLIRLQRMQKMIAVI